MSPTQINDCIESGTFSKCFSYELPYSKESYLEFVKQWKETYKKLSAARRAYRPLAKVIRIESARMAVPLWYFSIAPERLSLTKEAAEQLAELKAKTHFALPSNLGFVKLERPDLPTSHMLLVLRKQMKIESNKLYLQSKEKAVS